MSGNSTRLLEAGGSLMWPNAPHPPGALSERGGQVRLPVSLHIIPPGCFPKPFTEVQLKPMDEGTHIEIRDVRAEDLSGVVALARELQAAEQAMFERMRSPLDIGSDYVEAVLDDCRKFGGCIIVAEAAGTLVGYAAVYTSFREESRDEKDYTFAYVADLVVTRACRSAGVGYRLLAICEDIARKSGARWLRISTLAANERALAVYHRFGFVDHFLTLEKPLQ